MLGKTFTCGPSVEAAYWNILKESKAMYQFCITMILQILQPMYRLSPFVNCSKTVEYDGPIHLETRFRSTPERRRAVLLHTI
jgi:hypothetical protein